MERESHAPAGGVQRAAREGERRTWTRAQATTGSRGVLGVGRPAATDATERGESTWLVLSGAPCATSRHWLSQRLRGRAGSARCARRGAENSRAARCTHAPIAPPLFSGHLHTLAQPWGFPPPPRFRTVIGDGGRSFPRFGGRRRWASGRVVRTAWISEAVGASVRAGVSAVRVDRAWASEDLPLREHGGRDSDNS